MPAKKEAKDKKPRAPRAKKEGAAPKRPRKVKPATGSVGLTAQEVAAAGAPAAITGLATAIEAAGGAVLARYRDPLGGHWLVLASLPIDAVTPTPYQRELSKAHAEKLAGVIPKVGRFLDPIVAVPDGAGFITPNGMHRLQAMRDLGARAIIALVMPEPEVAFRILALNTEKAHNLKDKALEVVRMVRALVREPKTARRKETEYALEFEQAALITMGLCYEANQRFSGGAYMPVVSRCDTLRDEALEDTVPDREVLAKQLLELDAAVVDAVARLKESGFTSGYLKPLVVSRINPLRWVKADAAAPKPDMEKTIAKMLDSAKKFDPSKIKAADVAAAAFMGGSDGE